jgi:ATP-dependent exoDNAse (exonuclease V) alpha subunit
MNEGVQEPDSGSKLEKKVGASLKPGTGIARQLAAQFPFEPTPGQQALFLLFQDWMNEKGRSKPVFLLKGYAGTGKTSFLRALVKVLPGRKVPFYLMAPTGRASKVMQSYTRRLALTLHKKVFRFEPDEVGYPRLIRQKNPASNSLFVVDEASMVGNQTEYGSRGILEELIRYVFENPGNRLLFIGDTAQLPPVGTDLSLALKASELAGRFGVSVVEHELADVVRQDLDSGILENATRLREVIRGQVTSFTLITKGFPDVFRVPAARVMEGIDYCYQKFGMERTLVVTRTNRQAQRYNSGIRGHILFREEELETGDWLMVVKNNYALASAERKGHFIANGDLARVSRVYGNSDHHPLRLFHLELVFPDGEEEEVLDARAFAGLLYSDKPQMDEAGLQVFQKSLLEDWASEEPSLKKRMARLKTDPEANALQIKFGYAVTCHKAQGGQWDAVFVDHGFLKETEPDTEFYRWLYTAFTRASRQLFVVAPDDRLLGGMAPPSGTRPGLR